MKTNRELVELNWINMIPWLAMFFSIFLIFRRQNWLENEFLQLLKIIGSLKFHQFNHEAQLLGQNGVYIPEDTALFVYNLLWNLAGENEQQSIQEEYEKNCPDNIPFWKYFIYRYKIKCEFKAREPMENFCSAKDIQMSGIVQTLSQNCSSLNAQMNEIKEMAKNVKKVQEQVENTENRISTIESK